MIVIFLNQQILKVFLLSSLFTAFVSFCEANDSSTTSKSVNREDSRTNTHFASTDTENNTNLEKNSPLSDFLITANTDTIICFGATVLFSVPNGAQFVNPVFQWRKNNTVVGSNSQTYLDRSLLNGDSIVCIIIETGQQFKSNSLKFTVLGIEPLIHISMDNYSCNYSSAAVYGSYLDLGNNLEDLSKWASVIIPAGSDNAVSGLITMPFTFKFAGVDFNKFSVSTNGRMAFGNTIVDSSGNNTEAFGNFTLMPWWDDLTTGINGNVRYKFFVEKEVTRLVIEWNVNASGVNLPFDRTIQVRLVQDVNNIIYLYSNNNAIAGTGSATIGIAGSNTDFLSALLQSYPESSNASSINRIDNNKWLNVPFSNTSGAAFFNSCQVDSVVYGRPVLFTALIDSLVRTPLYQWKKNNVDVGTNSRFYIDSSLLNNDLITCTLSSSTTCIIRSTISNNISVYVKSRSYIFFNGNGKWSDPANWSNGQVPPNNIPVGTGITVNPSPGRQCVVDIPITFLKGAQLTIKPGTHFIVQNSLIIL